MDRQAFFDQVGETVEPGGREPAPGALRLVQQFVNTYNHDLGSDRDRLLTPARAGAWLEDHELLEPGASLDEGDLERLKRLRSCLRSLAAANRDERAEDEQDIEEALDELSLGATLRVRFSASHPPSLEPASGGVDGVTARLLAIVHRAFIDGSWKRVKGCGQCGWLFYDRSKNRSSGWCAMSICGNRVKNRAYRKRVSGERAEGAR